MRFMITMDPSDVDRLDRFAAERGLTRSAAVRQAVFDYIDAAEKLPALRALMSGMAMQTGAVLSGEISKDQYDAALDDMQTQIGEIVRKK